MQYSISTRRKSIRRACGRIGTGIATSWLRIASAVGPTRSVIWSAPQGINSVFMMFAIVAVIGALAASQMIETGGRRLEETSS